MNPVKINSGCKICKFMFMRAEFVTVYTHCDKVMLVHRGCFKRVALHDGIEVLGLVVFKMDKNGKLIYEVV